jgi:hypothetical protein
MIQYFALLADFPIDSGLASLITGSGGALVVLILWVKSLTSSNKRLEVESRDISRQSIECITKILERQDQEKREKAYEDIWKKEITEMITKIHNSLYSDNR